ncbi:MAG: hypothetical protein ACYC8S_03745 [Minisyncoccota bacterium]
MHKMGLWITLSARLAEVRKLITERDPETMAVLQSIKMLAEKKHLIALPFFPVRDGDQHRSRKRAS